MAQGLVIAGTHSGCGKTTLTLGILAALNKKGFKVRSFKAGPDFIDAGLHGTVTGRPARNLDLWMCGEDYVRQCFSRHSAGSDISVVEGVMGMHDGDFSTARLATVLGLPVVLIVDAFGMAESAGAIVKGFAEYGAGVSGVIFNRVASDRHYERLKNSVREVPVLGYLPRSASYEIPHRHLGLATAEEGPLEESDLDELAGNVLEFMDMDLLVRKSASITDANPALPGFRASELRIGVAYDKAFCFYYEDNLDLLAAAGAELVRFSPLEDDRLPDGLDALYIGGGYPELYAKRLSANKAMLSSVRDWCGSGRPAYAECGGLMYLSRGIHDFSGSFFAMAGVLPFATAMKKGRTSLGYREIELSDDCMVGRKGALARGHEFHYSEIMGDGEGVDTIYRMTGSITPEGYRVGSTLASYVHLHFGSNPDIAHNLIRFIKERRP